MGKWHLEEADAFSSALELLGEVESLSQEAES